MVTAARAAAVASAAPAPARGLLPWLAAPLAEALRLQHGHALLVQGPEGVGQFEFSIALARAWLCETPLADRPGGLACSRCEGCHLATHDQVHPDLRVLMPEAMHLALGWCQKGEDEPDGKKPSQWISVDQVRAAIEFSTLTRGRASLKVIVVHPAERMPPIAASALLKLLEEPPGAQRFVLGCGDAQALLPTVRSRCHALALPLPERDAASVWLAAAGLADAPLLLDAAGGQPLAALERHAAGLDAALWRALPQAVQRGTATALGSLPVPLAVDAMFKLCHDAMLAACGVAPRYFPAGTVPDNGGDLRRLVDWADALKRIARHADHPWQAGLMLEALVQQGQRALAGGAPAGLPGAFRSPTERRPT